MIYFFSANYFFSVARASGRLGHFPRTCGLTLSNLRKLDIQKRKTEMLTYLYDDDHPYLSHGRRVYVGQASTPLLWYITFSLCH